MKKTLQNVFYAAILFLLCPYVALAQAPTLGTMAGFVLFSTNGAVTNSGISQLTGNVGTNNGSNTGFGNVNGVMNSANAATSQGAADLLLAYNQLNSTTPNYFISNAIGNNDTLVAGVYSISSASTLSGTLTLNANGNASAVFIFKIQGALSSAANSKVRLINGAKACNVFWKIEGLVSMAAGTTMRGTIIANNAAINMNSGDTLEGRALSTTGAVTLNGTFAYTPIGCGSPTLTGPAAPAAGATAIWALFTSTGQVTNSGITYVTGDVGTNNGTTAGFDTLLVTGKVHPTNDTGTASAAAALTGIYSYLNTLPHDIQLLYPAQFGGNLVLTPHTYLLSAATTLIDTVYLNAQGNANAVFVIKITGAFSTSTNARVLLVNGTQAQNVYWKIDGATSINTNSIFRGNIVVNGGGFSMSSGSVLLGKALVTGGAITIASATITKQGPAATTPDLIISTTTGAQGTYNNVTITSTGNATLTGNLVVQGNMIVQTGGKLNTADYLVQGNNAFTLSPRATLVISSPNGISTSGNTGDILVTGTRTFSATATYIYDGTALQVFGSGLPAAVDTLIINNPYGVSLLAAQTVNYKLTLGNGNIFIGTNDLIIGSSGVITGSSASGYIATTENATTGGTLKRTVVSAGPAILFPVGSATSKGSYTPATVTMPSGTTDVISVRVFRGVKNAGLTGAAVTSHVVNRSWVISEAVAGGSNATVQLQWNDTMELAPFIRSKTGIAHHNGISWNLPAASSYAPATGTNPYTSTRSGITSFSTFITGDSTNNTTLPVSLTGFAATLANEITVNWQTASEINSDYFEVERSTDNNKFVSIGIVKAAGNSTRVNNYNLTDSKLSMLNLSTVYYRLKQADVDGSVVTYGPITVNVNNGSSAFEMVAAPNPFADNLQLSVNGSVADVTVTIFNSQGQLVIQNVHHVAAGSTSINIDNASALAPGIYLINATSNGSVFRQKLVKSN
ncbi:MAG: DUF3494 domain-containing protein [Bacteroidia bacterium]|nr:DUF3494 domain-containing protein [Bacteroidia bacterium]